jgi:hypothetical protein
MDDIDQYVSVERTAVSVNDGKQLPSRLNAKEKTVPYESDTVLTSVGPNKEEEVISMAPELRDLLSKFIDAQVLPGHSITKEEWDRACVLCGRYCLPFIKEQGKT